MCSVLDELDFTVKTFNCLKRAGIHTFTDVCEKLSEGILTCMSIRNIGQEELEEMLYKAQEAGYPADRVVEHHIVILQSDPKITSETIQYWKELKNNLRA